MAAHIMREGLLAEIYSNRPVHSIPRFEGSIVTGRDWSAYETRLGVKPEALEHKTVLNFGSGASLLGKDLKTLGISCDVIDLDLKFDVWKDSEDLFRVFAAIPVHLYQKFLTFDEQTRQKLVHLKQKIIGSDGRNFVQGNGRALPFPDASFDHVLALWSTYQIPLDAKENVYRELLRVGNTLHMNPIFQNDYDVLSRLAEEQGYDIVVCHAQRFFVHEIPYMFSADEDYERCMEKFSQAERINIPTEQESFVTTIFGMKEGRSGGGNTIVIQRRSREKMRGRLPPPVK